jgi:hypothetical protein
MGDKSVKPIMNTTIADKGEIFRCSDLIFQIFLSKEFFKLFIFIHDKYFKKNVIYNTRIEIVTYKCLKFEVTGVQKELRIDIFMINLVFLLL